jgi:hypothetical protein
MSFVSGCLGVEWYQDTQLSIIGKLELKLYQEEIYATHEEIW